MVPARFFVTYQGRIVSALPVTPSVDAPARRPGTLVAAIGVAVIAALASILNGIMIATGGTELVRDLLVKAGMPPEMSDGDLELAVQLVGYESLDDFVGTFEMRGYLAVAAGAALLVFALLMRKAATWARTLVTVASLGTILFSIIIVGDETTGMMAGLAMLTILGSVLVIVLTWLPANGRYAKTA